MATENVQFVVSDFMIHSVSGSWSKVLGYAQYSSEFFVPCRDILNRKHRYVFRRMNN